MHDINEAMDALTHGVYVLGVHTPQKDNLMTAAWLCQVSGRPPMIAAAVSASHLTAELIKQAGSFTVSVLRPEQKTLAVLNGTVTGRKKDKLAETCTHMGALGHPVVDEAAAILECRVTDTVQASDHVVFIAEVVSGERFSGEPLIYRKKEFFS